MKPEKAKYLYCFVYLFCQLVCGDGMEADIRLLLRRRSGEEFILSYMFCIFYKLILSLY